MLSQDIDMTYEIVHAVIVCHHLCMNTLVLICTWVVFISIEVLHTIGDRVMPLYATYLGGPVNIDSVIIITTRKEYVLNS